MNIDRDEIIRRLESLSTPESVEGMARYGITSKRVLGLPMGDLRAMAREVGRDHQLALDLWDAGIHETRILASLVDDPTQVKEDQMERWVGDFDNWAVCDSVCGNLFRHTLFAHEKCVEWTTREEEYVKRAGFALMASLAVSGRKAPDSVFEDYLPPIVRESTDGRKYVRKAVNWALRQIGKRNTHLNHEAIGAAESILEKDSKAARWIAVDALRELRSDKVQEMVERRSRKA